MTSSSRGTTNILIASEDRREFERVRAKYRDELRPLGPVERTLFDELVASAWQLRRVRAAVLGGQPTPREADRLAHHHTRVERTFHLCLKELKASIGRRPHVVGASKRDRKPVDPMPAA